MDTVKEESKRLSDGWKKGERDFCHTSCLGLSCQTTQKAIGVVIGRMLLYPQALYLPDGGC